ncbi:MAG: hypothetical protein PHU35_06155 [Bacteroidales bacterium]|nr:hypothetical protein [Bacteroidales bacterium]
MKNKISKRFIEALGYLAILLATFSIITLGSENGYDNTLVYITSSIALVFAFIVSITQQLLNKYTKQVFGFLFLIIFIVVVELYSNQPSITPILLIISATISLLTFNAIEKDRKKQEEKAIKEEDDEKPFIISKPSDFEIKEEDFDIKESEDLK